MSEFVTLQYVAMAQSILTAAASAVGYSVVFYAKKRIGKDKQKFEPRKLAATILTGAAIGVIAAVTGSPLNQETISTQLAAYTGIIALVESGLKFVSRAISDQSADE